MFDLPASCGLRNGNKRDWRRKAQRRRGQMHQLFTDVGSRDAEPTQNPSRQILRADALTTSSLEPCRRGGRVQMEIRTVLDSRMLVNGSNTFVPRPMHQRGAPSLWRSAPKVPGPPGPQSAIPIHLVFFPAVPQEPTPSLPCWSSQPRRQSTKELRRSGTTAPPASCEGGVSPAGTTLAFGRAVLWQAPPSRPRASNTSLPTTESRRGPIDGPAPRGRPQRRPC